MKLIRSITMAVATFGLGLILSQCGSTEKKTETSTSSLDFTTDIKPIITARCGTGNGSCHASGANKGSFANSAELFKASTSKAQINAGSMPQAGSSEAAAFTADEKSKLLTFLN